MNIGKAIGREPGPAPDFLQGLQPVCHPACHLADANLAHCIMMGMARPFHRSAKPFSHA